MSVYAFVQSGVVITLYNGLPGQYGNIPNFNQLTDAQVLEYGFYPYSYTMPSYDPISQYLSDVQYTVNPTTVTGSNAVLALSSDEIATNMAALASLVYDELLNSMYLTDWAILSDSGLSGAQLTSYTTLRSSMRTSLAAVNSYNQSQLESLRDSLATAVPDIDDRPLAFTSSMTALQTVLSGL